MNGGYFDETKSRARSNPKPLSSHQPHVGDRAKLVGRDRKRGTGKSKSDTNNGKNEGMDDSIMASSKSKKSSVGNTQSSIATKGAKAVPLQQQTSTKIVSSSTLYQPRTTPKTKVPITSYRQAILGNASSNQNKSEDKKIKSPTTSVNGYNLDPLQLSISNNRSTKNKQRTKTKRKEKKKTKRPTTPTNLSPNSSSTVNEDDNISASSPMLSSSPYVDASSFSPSSDRSVDCLDLSHDSVVSVEVEAPKGQIPFHKAAPQASPAHPDNNDVSYLRPPPGLIPPPGLAAPPGFSTMIGGSPLLTSSTPDVVKDESLHSPDSHVRKNSIVGGRPLVESVSSPFPTPPLFDYNDAVIRDKVNALNGDDSSALPIVAEAAPSSHANESLPISAPSLSDDPLAELASNSFLFSQAENSIASNTSLAVGSNLKGSSSLLGTKAAEPSGISLSSGLWNNDSDLRLFSASSVKPSVSDGFNIEHFLDGILNENSMNEEDDAVVATAIAAVSGSSPASWTNGSNGANQSDSLRQESRAFAYGINVAPVAENKDSDDFYERDDFFESHFSNTTTDDDSK